MRRQHDVAERKGRTHQNDAHKQAAAREGSLESCRLKEIMDSEIRVASHVASGISKLVALAVNRNKNLSG